MSDDENLDGTEDSGALTSLGLNAELLMLTLDDEDRAALELEAVWVRKQIAAGRVPSSEAMLANAPVAMRLLAQLDGDDQ